MTKQFTALEDYASVLKASDEFAAAFRVGSRPRPGMGSEILWLPKVGIWGHFNKWKTEGKQLRLWNGFGLINADHRRNTVVELNPYCKGKSTNYQGLVAIDGDGRRVLFHRGRMSVPGAGVSEEDFDRVTGRKRTLVAFSGNEALPYHRVADLDHGPSVLQRQMAEFVKECSKVRATFLVGANAAAEEAAIQEAEVGAPELTTPYEIGPQAARTARRTHGKVWHALAAALTARGVKHSNARVGRWGPDLRTIEGGRVLFEIKVTVSAHDVQRAVGQLVLYEVLLRKEYRKVIVVPGSLGKEAGQGLESVGFDVLKFRNTDGKIGFAAKDLNHVLRP